MNRELRIIDEKNNTIQITLTDERWYGYDRLSYEEYLFQKTQFEATQKETEGEESLFVSYEDWLAGKEKGYFYDPSITWITSYYPKGVGYMRWLADKGFDEAERIKTEAGDRGTIVHHAIEKLLAEKSIKMDDKIKDREGEEREMTPDEYYCVLTFSQWYESVGRPEPIMIEKTVRSREHGYSGTLDYLFKTEAGSLLIDVKTSKQVWPSHELQVSALKKALEENGTEVHGMGILQVGYTANKKQHYKFTEIEDKFNLFLAAKEIWANENDGSKPFQRDYPLSITLPEAQEAPVEQSEVQSNA